MLPPTMEIRSTQPSRIRLTLLPFGLHWLAVCLGLLALAGIAPGSPVAAVSSEYRADQILLQPKADMNSATLGAFHSTQKSVVVGTFAGLGGLQIVRLPVGETVPGFIAKCEQSGL